MKKIISLSVVLFCTLTVQAQSLFSYGIKAGANLNKFQMSSETDDTGKKLDKNTLTFGFNIGILGRVKLTDKLGLQAEFLFTQRGTRYKYDGSTTYSLLPRFETDATNARRYEIINVTNGYLSLPIMLNYDINRFRIGLGVAPSLMISSKALGLIRYTDDDPDLTSGKIEFDLQYNYKKDKPESPTTLGAQSILGKTYPTIISAYYLEQTKKGNMYNSFDLSTVIDLSYAPNPSGKFRIGMRADLGLFDISNDYYEVSKYKLNDDKTFKNIANKDRNLALQAYLLLGF